MYAPAGQEEAQVQQAQELAAGDSYDYGNDQTPSGNDVSNPYLGVASDPTIAAMASGMRNSVREGNPFSPTIMNFADYNALRGTTLADPFRDNPAGIMSAIPFDYRSQRNTYDDLQRQYAQFMNPYGAGSGGNMSVLNSLDKESRKALAADLQRMDKNPFDSGDREKGDLRSGLQRKYGSIFGSNTGLPTFQGNVVDQDRQFSTGEMLARGLAGLAPGPIGTILSQVGKTKPTLDTSPTYDRTKDPNSPDYQGTGYLGSLANVFTGGAGTQIGKAVIDETTDIVTQAMDWAKNLGKPENKSITDPNYEEAVGTSGALRSENKLFAPGTAEYEYGIKGTTPKEQEELRELRDIDDAEFAPSTTEAFNTGIANIDPEVTDNAMKMQPEMDMIQGPPELTNLKVNNLGLIGAPGYSISGGFDYPGTDRDINTSTSTSTGQVVTFDKDGGFNFEKRYPTEEEAYQKFLKEMYTD